MEIKEKVYTVKVWEMDSWSGRSLLETRHFTSLREAERLIKEINSKNTEEYVPEYYTYAELI